MKTTKGIGLENVKAVYNGAEGDLWELVMGEQIHIGGFASSMDLAERSGVGPGMSGIDLCCCNGAGMRFLVRFRNVDSMHGVDATETVIDRCRERSQAEGLGGKIDVTLADVCCNGLPDEGVDFVWGEDAWCYVVDKPKLISEAVRLVKRGGTIAFTDWVEGSVAMSDAEAERFLQFMKFPNIESVGGYSKLLGANGADVVIAEETDRFAPYIDLYLDMLNKQLTYDALKIIGFDTDLMGAMGGEMAFMRQLAHDGKIAQGIFVARRK
ncbi:MAG: class I SAM-dependent methyltransferase [Planctomycetota bacterium]|jgi:SAM-dependent methyltransferase